MYGIELEFESNRVKYGKPLYEEEDYFYLPHSCDEWVIGGLDEAKQMVADLQRLIELLETGEQE